MTVWKYQINVLNSKYKETVHFFVSFIPRANDVVSNLSILLKHQTQRLQFSAILISGGKIFQMTLQLYVNDNFKISDFQATADCWASIH